MLVMSELSRDTRKSL